MSISRQFYVIFLPKGLHEFATFFLCFTCCIHLYSARYRNLTFKLNQLQNEPWLLWVYKPQYFNWILQSCKKFRLRAIFDWWGKFGAKFTASSILTAGYISGAITLPRKTQIILKNENLRKQLFMAVPGSGGLVTGLTSLHKRSIFQESICAKVDTLR